MKKTILILITIFLLTSCTTYENDSTAKKEVSSFEKNKECFSYAENLSKEYENEENTSVESVFYSPKADSCLYLYVTIAGLQIHSELRDVFTNETILESNKFVSDFQDEIRELGYYE